MSLLLILLVSQFEFQSTIYSTGIIKNVFENSATNFPIAITTVLERAANGLLEAYHFES